MSVHVVAQPTQQRRELAALYLFGQVGNRDDDGIPQLCRVQVADRVGREVADRSHRPVHVLQAAPSVVGRGGSREARATPPHPQRVFMQQRPRRAESKSDSS